MVGAIRLAILFGFHPSSQPAAELLVIGDQTSDRDSAGSASAAVTQRRQPPTDLGGLS